jgi:hypothetical protein
MKYADLLLKENRNRFYIMHLSYGYDEDKDKDIDLWKFAVKRNLIGLDLINYVKDDWPRVRNSAAKSLKTARLGIWTRQFDMFCENMADFSMMKEDLVLVLEGWSHLLGVARVKSDHSYRAKLASGRGGVFFDHVREVEWIKQHDFEDRPRIPSVEGFNNTLSIVEKSSNRWSKLGAIPIGS